MNSFYQHISKSTVLLVAVLLPAERVLMATGCCGPTPRIGCCGSIGGGAAESAGGAGISCCRDYGEPTSDCPCRTDCCCGRSPETVDPTTGRVPVAGDSEAVVTSILGTSDTMSVSLPHIVLTRSYRCILLSILYCRLLR